ncbi:MAG: T9SS type A sorting domain-containing protein [Bacteroidetes bacterium]|nr:T9SS type A sorting domain-containing protein [Bacteroidota bacterium]
MNNDEYQLSIGENLIPGEYFLAARFAYGDSVYFGGYSASGGGKWDSETNSNKRILVITETLKESEREINTFSLSQNYPNPFNPTTEIRFSIPQSELVTLTVYNVLGEKVATLIQSNLSAGSHSISFNASKIVSSGVYFYRLQVGDYAQTKQMLLIK